MGPVYIQFLYYLLAVFYFNLHEQFASGPHKHFEAAFKSYQMFCKYEVPNGNAGLYVGMRLCMDGYYCYEYSTSV